MPASAAFVAIPRKNLASRSFLWRRSFGNWRSPGPVIPAQLVLIAEMFRGRPWTRQELQRCGGVRGVLSQYLDDRITGPSAHPVLRRHTDATFRLLRALLPPAGTAIKDRPRSIVDLRNGRHCQIGPFAERFWIPWSKTCVC